MTSSSERRFPLNAKDYELFEEIGDGVGATVYRSRCIVFDDIVAIKILDLEKYRNDVETIQKEVLKRSLVDHPNLLKAHCSFIDGSSFWIVMPYMSCGSCFHIMKSVYPEGLEQPVIATLLREVLTALDYLHGQGHIHRDVKAGNILVDSKGTVKLGDFGVSGCMFDSVERMRTGNTSLTTPCWMAPEVMQQVDGYDFKADIWSFGITALELAHGHAPFSKYPPMKVFQMTLQNAIPGLDYEKDKKFLKSFRELVAACLVKDPKNRPTAAELLKHPFFKNAHSTEYLSRTILDGLSPLGEPYRKLKEEKAKLPKGIDDNTEKLSQREYLRGICAWNFDLEDLRKQTTLIPDDELSISEDFEFVVPKGNPFVESSQDVMSISSSLLTEALSPSSPSQFLPSPGEHVDIPSGAEESPICEEEPLEQRLASDNKQMENAENDLDELKNDEALTSVIPASPVNPLSGNVAQILPLLQNLLFHNEIQRERLIGLIQLYDPTAENRNAIVSTEGGQISTETDLLSEVQILEQSVEKLEEEVENQKKANAQLEEEIKWLRRSSDPEEDN